MAWIALTLVAVPALSAELPVKAGVDAPTPAAFNWSGWYVGGHVGYARGANRNALFDSAPVDQRDTFGALYGGLQGGYNYVFPSGFLFGLEGDISFPEFFEDGVVARRATRRGADVTDQIDFISTFRARFGHVIDHVMVYGTAGLALAQARFTETPGLVADQDKALRGRVGWTAGVGAEFAIAPDWSARIEYRYDRLGNASATLPSGTAIASTFDTHTLRFGLNYYFDRADTAASRTQPVVSSWPVVADDWNVHGQFTFIAQAYPAFRSPYQGTNSLSGANQAKNTTSATAFLGLRLWTGTEFYINPELMQGSGLSDTFGLAGYPNGEAQKSGFPMPRLNIARILVRHTFGLGGEQEVFEDGANRLPGKVDISRITITAGKMSVIDVFDGNNYSHDPRADFMNWNIYCCGSYDLTMDKVGYTWGAFAELNQKQWAFRAGYFLLPVVSNDNRFDTHIPDRGEFIAELELRYALGGRPGKFRLMGWINRGTAGSYAEAVALPLNSPNYPDIALTRRVRSNYGFVANIEQAITDDLGIFSRASWNAGQTEKLGWTDTDQSLSLGALLKGTTWGRPNDRIGIGGVIEGLSPEARAYFAAGGLGILIGDGALNYRPEQVLEAFYSYSVNKWLNATLDYQFIVNPAYNADRGPVSIFGLRLHGEF